MADNLVDIKEIGPSGHTLRLHFGPWTPADPGESLEILSADLGGEIRRTRLGGRLSGQLGARVRIACSRCLADVEIPIEQQVTLDLLLDGPVAVPGEVRVGAADTLGFPAIEGRVDLREVVTEQVYLHLPLKPLCRPDCSGLCPACGENRNLLECDCRNADLDPRLAPLADLKRRMERG